LGRTVSTYSEVVKAELKKWKGFRKGLKRRDRKVFDKVIDYAKLNRSAGSQMANPNPFQPMVLSVLLEQQREIERLKNEIGEKV